MSGISEGRRPRWCASQMHTLGLRRMIVCEGQSLFEPILHTMYYGRLLHSMAYTIFHGRNHSSQREARISNGEQQ